MVRKECKWRNDCSEVAGFLTRWSAYSGVGVKSIYGPQDDISGISCIFLLRSNYFQQLAFFFSKPLPANCKQLDANTAQSGLARAVIGAKCTCIIWTELFKNLICY